MSLTLVSGLYGVLHLKLSAFYQVLHRGQGQDPLRQLLSRRRPGCPAEGRGHQEEPRPGMNRPFTIFDRQIGPGDRVPVTRPPFFVIAGIFRRLTKKMRKKDCL